MPCFTKLANAVKGTINTLSTDLGIIYLNVENIISISVLLMNDGKNTKITIIDCVGGQRYSTLEDIEQVLYKCKNVQQG